MADFLRQLDIIDPKKLVYPVTCIGLGGIGSFTAAALRKIGFQKFILYDGDVVEAHNIPSQNFPWESEGSTKVSATEKVLRESLDSEVEITAYDRRFTENDHLEGIVVAGVDSMSSRQAIWKAVQNNRALVPLFLDGRIGVEWDEKERKVKGEWIEVFSLNPSSFSDIELYESHLFPEEEAAALHCTAQAVIYIGYFIAAFISSSIRKWACGEEIHRYLLYDALTSDIISAIK
ncbi:MAG: ThiF family adenylyltransferase [Patescibacteria group bacterium]|nr:ThiF family adenylyltransferase [Patescibacteria group bacterium]MDE2015678.1 ThiF family adenylyltransferase [Patescibacteria group bacterium]MDE2226735.1 ThiF family adenylyltransferase [Patescibacteria group bacterium]